MDNPTQLEFRKTSQEDIYRLAELRIKQLIDEGYPETTDILEDLIRYFTTSLENGSLICWVGESNGEILATAGICFYQLPPSFSNPSGRIAYITNMYTDKSHRKKGVASYLLEKLIEEARFQNCTSVRLHASIHGKGIYEKVGFYETDGYMGMPL